MLSNQWIVPNFYPIAYLPRGVRLTAYAGGSGDLPAEVLQRHLDRLGAGEVSLGPIRVYALGQIRQAHADMEQNRTFGKMVVTISP
jgi:hypothetical protein